MLARLQRALTLSAVSIAVLWAAWWIHADKLARAGIGAAVILGGYAAVLALEFFLLQLARGNDATPRARPTQLLNAWWGELLSAPLVFCWRQPFRSNRWPDQLPAGAAGKQGVLLIHGFFCNRGLWNHWLQRLTTQQVPFVAINMEPVFGSIDDGVGAIEQGLRRLEACTGRPPVVVAHSMGGLALRCWWAQQADSTRVHHGITIGSPHQGTWLARFAVSANARQMRLGSDWLTALAAREPADRYRHFTCFYSHCDNIVFPPATATLYGASNRHLEAVAHVHMVDHPAPWQALQDLLGGKDRTLSRAG